MSEPTLLDNQRENWGSRPGFVLAAIGSAVGLGNLWAFPYKLYSFGGGAFLIPYIIAMLLIGIPLLIAEFSLGHLTQRATPDAFGRANRKFAFVGWWQIILSFVIITYYAVILAYCVSFLKYSIEGIFTGQLPWAGKGTAGVEKANDFFFNDYLHFTNGFSLGKFQVHIIAALAVTWIAMYLCICRGVKLVSKVVLWTVPLPWLMLLILAIRGLTLDGAVQGLEYYLEPNWSKLASPTTWRWAFGQMFFSMSLAFGIMVTYSSFLHRKSDLNNNAAVIGLADMGTSFLAGLAVFATLGGMAFATQMAGAAVPVEEVAKSGPSLAFVAFPYALAQLPYSAWFSLLFFASLLLLGIDSAFSITECVLASLVDKTGWHRGKVLIAISLIGFGIGVLFCCQGGLNWLGTFDDFINGTWGITLTALLECFVLGWLFRINRLREHANERSDWQVGRWWNWTIRLIIPAVLAVLFTWSLFDSMKDPSGYARKYAHDPHELSLQVPKTLPTRPLLEVQFVADFNGQSENAIMLDETDPGSLASWKLPALANAEVPASNPTTQTVSKGFQTASLCGKTLGFDSTGTKPNTAYTVQYRWTSKPEKDPKTGLPIVMADSGQTSWEHLTSLTTNSVRQGLNTGSCAGLCLMAVAPFLAILISAKRFGKARDDTIKLLYEDPKPRGKFLGMLSIMLGLVAVGMLAGVFMDLLAKEHAMRAGLQSNASKSLLEIIGLGSPLQGLSAGGALAAAALLCGALPVVRFEKLRIRASMAPRLGAGIGILALGICGGLGITYAMMTMRFPVKPNEYDNELSGTSYLILACMLALIVVGLGWCFYRSIKAAGIGQSQQQVSEEVNQD